MRICGIDFGMRQYAVVSDGYIQLIQLPITVESTAQALLELGRHIENKYDVVIIEGVRGSNLIAKNIKWFKLSMRRRYPHIRVIRADDSFPSSQLCNKCGLKTKIHGETFECASCGHIDDRDLNAAKNLRDWKTRTFAGWNGA